MRIAVVHTPLWGRGGAERQVLTLAVELQKRGHEVELFTPAFNEKTCYPELLKQIKINTIPQNRFIPFSLIDASASSTSKVGEVVHSANRLRTVAVHQFYTLGLPSMLSLGKLIPKEFDIINNHNAPTEWAAFTAKRRLKIPIVWMCNEPPSWFYFGGKRRLGESLSWPLFKLWDKTSVRYIDEILVLSHAAQKLVKKVYNLPSKVVRTGVDVNKYINVSGIEARKRLGLENSFVLLQVANLAPVKRQFDSIKALHYVSKNHKNVKLVLDGAGPQDELRKLSEKLGVKDKVVFSHAKCDTELAEVYAACDAFVFPPQITWGLAVIEAMASSKPVIVAKGCGAAEIIRDGVNGMTVEYANPKAMAERIETLITDLSLCRKMGKNAFEYVKDNLSWEKYADQMEAIFQAAAKRY